MLRAADSSPRPVESGWNKEVMMEAIQRLWMQNDWEPLVSSLFCDISKCRCGVYSVRIEKVTVQLTALQFG
jgi:hypothetical protein